MKFDERLEIVLSLVAGSSTLSVEGGAVKALSLRLLPYGFEGEAAFVISAEQEADPVFSSFTGSDPISLGVQVRTLRKGEAAADSEVTKVTGLVTERGFEEKIGADVSGAPVSVRRYTVAFADPAAVLWRQHFPTELTTATTFHQVIDGHKPAGVTLQFSLRALEEDRSQVFLALGDEGDGEASFYDWLLWILDRYQGVFEHDYATGGYRLADGKKEDDTPAEAVPEELDGVSLGLPAPPRRAGRVVNASSVAPTPVPVPNTSAVTGVVRDVLVRTPLPAEVARRVVLEKERLRGPKDELSLSFARFPWASLAPGRYLTFGEEFSERARTHGDPFRSVGFFLRAQVTEERWEANLEEADAEYHLAVEVELERVSHPIPRLPPYTAPRYPLRVEGKVVSPAGGDEERTWLAIEDEATSALTYEVEVPLWNKKVTAPFEPGPLTGRFFFPAYKHARVLVALDLERARISRFLDWAQNARTPADGQGNRVVFGKRDKDGTVLDYSYVDQKPSLTLERKLGNDIQTLAITEGSLKITVREDPTAQKIEPKFDVTVQVEAAKGEISTAVRGSVTELSGKFEGAVGGTKASLVGATGELVAAVEQMETEINGTLDQARGEIESAMSALEDALAGVAAKVMAAKSELLAAISD